MATIPEELAAASILDTLQRSENPIKTPYLVMNPGVAPGQLIKNGYSSSSIFAAGFNSCYYSTSSFSTSGGKLIYALATISEKASSTSRSNGLWVCRPTASTATTQNGYLLRFEKTAGLPKFTLEKVTGGTFVVQAEKEIEIAVGARVAIVVGEGNVRFYLSSGEATEFVETLSFSDSTYTDGYTGFLVRGAEQMTIKNFGTGTFTSEEEEEEEPTGSVKIKSGGSVVSASRWVKVGGELVRA